MDLYELNYRRIERLIPELDLPFSEAVSRADTDLPLYLTVMSRDRFTATFRLTYEFVTEEGLRRQPDIWVRIYRDAHVAEALECSHRPPLQLSDASDERVWEFLSAQWRRNLMLGKWLEYLLDQGHGFSMAERPRLITPVSSL